MSARQLHYRHVCFCLFSKMVSNAMQCNALLCNAIQYSVVQEDSSYQKPSLHPLSKKKVNNGIALLGSVGNRTWFEFMGNNQVTTTFFVVERKKTV